MSTMIGQMQTSSYFSALTKAIHRCQPGSRIHKKRSLSPIPCMSRQLLCQKGDQDRGWNAEVSRESAGYFEAIVHKAADPEADGRLGVLLHLWIGLITEPLRPTDGTFGRT